MITPIFRVSYPNVFVARKNDLSGKDEFSLVALFKKGEDITALQAEVLRAAKEKWGEGIIAKTTQGTHTFQPVGKAAFSIRLPFRDQGERASSEKGMPAGYEAGAMFINLKSNQRPGLVDAKRQDIIEASDFYAGCYAKAAVNAYAYDKKGNKGVSLGLQALQKVKDGDPLGNLIDPHTAFEAIEEVDTEAGAQSLF